MLTGEELKGNVFIHLSSYRPFELEDVSELFNADTPFFPLEGQRETREHARSAVEVTGKYASPSSGTRPGKHHVCVGPEPLRNAKMGG